MSMPSPSDNGLNQQHFQDQFPNQEKNYPHHPSQSNIHPNFFISPSNNSATAGMVLGIVSIVFSMLGVFSGGLCCIISIPAALGGVVASHIGFNNSKKVGVGSGSAITGLILNWLTVGGVILLILALLLFGFGAIIASV